MTKVNGVELPGAPFSAAVFAGMLLVSPAPVIVTRAGRAEAETGS